MQYKMNIMKKRNVVKSLFIAVSALTIFSSCSSVSGIQAVVVRDCTGTYIRLNDKDQLVCNSEKLKDYKDGDTVRVRLKKTTYCNELKDEAVCLMYHEHDGMVRVIEVHPKD
jgi:uncharacterized ubiquitin-like protein YukD